MKKRVIINHVEIVPLIGFGYWKDKYDINGVTGYAKNYILPFIRIQRGYLEGEHPMNYPEK